MKIVLIILISLFYIFIFIKISFDSQTNQWIENQYQLKSNPSFSHPIFQIEKFDEAIDVKSLSSISPKVTNFTIDFSKMMAVQTDNPSIKFKMFRVDSPSNEILKDRMIYKFEWKYKGSEILLRGSFDNWLSSIPLHKGEGGVREVTLLLPISLFFMLFFFFKFNLLIIFHLIYQLF